MALRSAPSRRTVADEDRPDSLWDMERSLRRRGFQVVAGADEAGRGACAGPLVAAACVLPSGRRGRVPGRTVNGRYIKPGSPIPAGYREENGKIVPAGGGGAGSGV